MAVTEQLRASVMVLAETNMKEAEVDAVTGMWSSSSQENTVYGASMAQRVRMPHEANLPPEELDRLKEQRRNVQNAAWAFADSRTRIESWARAHDVAQRRGLQRPPDEQ